LSGNIDYVEQIKDLKNFRGKIKLKKDPKGEDFNSDNLVLRGTQLLFTEWMCGLVLYTGMNCHCF
jgi:hypothetical protein